MKVLYSQKSNLKKINNVFKSTFNDYIFDINKNFNKYNNHIAPKDIYLDKMIGRETRDDSPLPSFMIKIYDRNSFNTLNNKSLEMNNYANGTLQELRSSFNDKKSFNYKLNEQYSDNIKDKYPLEPLEEMNTILKQLKYPKSINNEIKEYDPFSSTKKENPKKFGNYSSFSRIKIPEYYKVNLDKLGKYPYTNYERIDGFTFKTIKGNKSAIELMTNEEKKIFLTKLSQNK